ncbi:MAG: hypothetical protein WCQ53_08305, partial [bacterium]
VRTNIKPVEVPQLLKKETVTATPAPVPSVVAPAPTPPAQELKEKLSSTKKAIREEEYQDEATNADENVDQEVEKAPVVKKSRITKTPKAPVEEEEPAASAPAGDEFKDEINKITKEK